MSVSILSESTLDHHTAAVTEVYAQPYVETVKHRNLTIDLGNGLKTNAQLTVPAVGEGPFPGVIVFRACRRWISTFTDITILSYG